MARPQRADHRELLISVVAKQLTMGQEMHMANACREIGIVPSLANHYFADKSELSRLAWLRVIEANISRDFDRLTYLGDKVDWEGVESFIYEVFSPERSRIREAHIRGLASAFQDDELKDLLESAQAKTTTSWIDLLTKFTEAGVLNPKVDIGAIAVMFSALPLGVTAVHGELSDLHRKQLAAAWLQMLRAVL